MIQLRYPNITGKTPEERQNQMERYVRSLVDQLNMKKTTQEPTQTQENIPLAPQPKIDFSKMFESHIAEYWEKIYPVGAIYLSVSDTDPSTLFGGTWEQITDRFLLAAGSSYAAGATGGEAEHTLEINEMPSHVHNWKGYYSSYKHEGGGTLNLPIFGSDNASELIAKGLGPQAAGESQPHNNMPPYLAVYIWKRIS